MILSLNAGPLDDLKAGHWYQAPESKLDNCTERARTTQYPWLKEGAFRHIIESWAGGAYDTKRDNFLIGPGGGHNSYNGNEVYGFNLGDMAWHRLTDPDPAYLDYNNNVHECTADSVPFAMHTYDGVEYMPNIDRYVVVGSWCTSFTYALNFDTKKWEKWPDYGASRTGDASAYDPVSGHLFFIPGMANTLFELDPFSHTWSTPASPGAAYYSPAVVDYKRNLIVCVGHGNYPGHGVETIMTQAPYTCAWPSVTGDSEIIFAENPGVEYDPVMDKIVCWKNGNEVFSLDMDTKVWSRHLPVLSNTITPTPANVNGTYGRFRYIPSKNAYVVVNATADDVFFFKLTSWKDTIPATGLDIYAQDTVIEEYLSTNLTVTATRRDATRDTVTTSCVYNSLDPDILSTYAYRITAKATGVGRIQVVKSTANGTVMDTISITVVASTATPDSIRIVPGILKILASDSYRLTTTGYFHKLGQSFTRIIDTVVDWTSKNSTVASVNRGLVFGLHTGIPTATPVEIIASMGGKSDTLMLTVLPKPGFIKRINFQTTTTPWSYGWLGENGGIFDAATGLGWNTYLTSNARDDRNGSNFLLKSLVGGAANNTFRISVPDGSYIVKIAMGDNMYGTDGTAWTLFGSDTVCRKIAGHGNDIAVDTISVIGGTGALFTVTGPINYIVIISNEGIDINQVALDDGTFYPPSAPEPVFTPADESPSPAAASGLSAFPNPFNPAVTIVCKGLPKLISLAAYNLQGAKVADLLPELRNGSVLWRAHVPSGMYVIRAVANGRRFSKQVLLLK